MVGHPPALARLEHLQRRRRRPRVRRAPAGGPGWRRSSPRRCRRSGRAAASPRPSRPSLDAGAARSGPLLAVAEGCCRLPLPGRCRLRRRAGRRALGPGSLAADFGGFDAATRRGPAASALEALTGGLAVQLAAGAGVRRRARRRLAAEVAGGGGSRRAGGGPAVGVGDGAGAGSAGGARAGVAGRGWPSATARSAPPATRSESSGASRGRSRRLHRPGRARAARAAAGLRRAGATAGSLTAAPPPRRRWPGRRSGNGAGIGEAGRPSPAGR